jgi:hypothetical protein
LRLARNDLTFFFEMKQNGFWQWAQRIGARMSGSPQERATRRTACDTPKPTHGRELAEEIPEFQLNRAS